VQGQEADLVKNNASERQEVERVRDLVQQDLDELQGSIASHTAAGSQAAFVEILADRVSKLTETLRQSIKGIDKEDERTLGPTRTATAGTAGERPRGCVWCSSVSGLLPLDWPDHNRSQRVTTPKNRSSVARK
jgi:hypothetical protein